MAETKWFYHSRKMRELDRVIAKCETMVRRYKTQNRQHLVDKWRGKRREATQKKMEHQLALMKLWQSASEIEF